MAAALMAQDGVGTRDGRVEILGAVDGERQRQLLAGEREVAADAGFLDHEELFRPRPPVGSPQPRANTSASRAISVRESLPSGHSARWIFSFSIAEAR